MVAEKKYAVPAVCLLLAIAAIAAFERIRLNDFVDYDDPYHITENAHINKGLTLDGLNWAFSSTLTFNSTPMTWLSHMLDCAVFGTKPGFHHLMSLAIHILSTLLLFSILRKSTSAFWPSAFVAAIFAVHPLNTEPVAWISERTHILGMFFWMLTIAVYINYVRTGSRWNYLLTIVVFELGIMSKAIVVMLPFVLLLLDYWPLARFSSNTENLSPYRVLWKLAKEKIPFFALALVSSLITFFLYQSGGLVWSIEKLSPSMRILNAFVAYARYIGKIICPTNLAVLYPYPGNSLPVWQAIFAFLILTAVTILAIRFAKNRPYLIVGWLWFIIVLIPVIGVVQVGNQAIADRYAYVPMVGILIMIVWSANDLVGKKLLSKSACVALAAIVLIALAAASRAQVKYWKDSFALYEHTLSVTSNNYLMEHSYASLLLKHNRTDDAISHFQAALRINPRYYYSAYNLGHIFLKREKLDLARGYLEQALAAYPTDPYTHYDLAVVLMEKADYNNAIKHLEAALPTLPCSACAYYSLAQIFYLQGKLDIAARYFSISLRVDPGHLATRLALAHVLLETGHPAEALPHYYYALRRDSTAVYTLKNLAWILATIDDEGLRNPAAAVEFARRACVLTNYKDPAVLAALAVAYSALGQFDDACQTAQKALDIAVSSNRRELADDIQTQLKLYKANQPYRQPPVAVKKTSLEDLAL